MCRKRGRAFNLDSSPPIVGIDGWAADEPQPQGIVADFVRFGPIVCGFRERLFE